VQGERKKSNLTNPYRERERKVCFLWEAKQTDTRKPAVLRKKGDRKRKEPEGDVGKQERKGRGTINWLEVEKRGESAWG